MLGEAAAFNFDAVLEAGEDGGLVGGGCAGLEAKEHFAAAFGAGMLREQKHGGLGAFGCGAIAEPGGKRYTRSVLGGDAAHVEDDGGEASGLEDEIGDAESLLDTRPGLRGCDSRGGSGSGLGVSWGDWFARIERAALRFGTAGSEGFGAEKFTNRFGEAFGFGTWMGTESAAVEAFFCGGRGEAFFGQVKGFGSGRRAIGGDAATNPEQAGEIDAGGSGGFGIKGVVDVDPRGYAAGLGDLGQE